MDQNINQDMNTVPAGSPPPYDVNYYSPPPPQKKNHTLLIIIIVLVVLGCCCLVSAGVIYFLYANGDVIFNLSTVFPAWMTLV